jgi:hypothetical protein
MITKEEMVQPMLAACPSFIPTWREFIAEWKDDRAGPPLYVALGDLARHLVELLQQGKTEQFDAIFDVVERWHREGEHYVREAATVGLLEGIQNAAEYRGVDPSVFEPWLRPESKRWWDKLNLFWGEGTLMTDD